MKQYYIRVQITVWSFALALAAAFLAGCGPLDQKEIAGPYTRHYRGITDSISLNQDGTFQQSIEYTNATWKISGSWKVINRVIQLKKCYLTFEDEKQTNVLPPLLVDSCTFSVSRNELVRTQLQPPWTKANP